MLQQDGATPVDWDRSLYRENKKEKIKKFQGLYVAAKMDTERK